MYAGVDLAWGQRARTGVALVDDSGTLVASTSVHTDAQIKDFLAPHATTLAALAVDAPLIVANATGQ